MTNFESLSLERIKNKYKDTIDFSNPKDKSERIMYRFYGEITYSIEYYRFNEKIQTIKDALEIENNNINNSKFEKYNAEITELEANIKETVKNAGDDNYFYVKVMNFELKADKKLYRWEPNIEDIDKNLAKNIIAEASKKTLNTKSYLLFIMIS